MTLSAVVYGYRIAGPRLRLAREGTGERGTIVVERARRPLLSEPAELIRVVGAPALEELTFAVARAPGRLLAYCSSTGAYEIDSRAGRIISERVGGESWEDRMLNAVVPLLLIDRGQLLLHAAAVKTPQGALVFAGSSGSGKSTLVAVLEMLGMPVLADDVVALTMGGSGALVWPGAAGVRLDAATADALGQHRDFDPQVRGKRRYEPVRALAAEPVALAGIVVLDRRRGRDFELRRIARAWALGALFPNVYGLEPAGEQRLLTLAGALVRQAVCFRVQLPDELRALPQLASRLLAQVGVQHAQAA